MTLMTDQVMMDSKAYKAPIFMFPFLVFLGYNDSSGKRFFVKIKYTFVLVFITA